MADKYRVNRDSVNNHPESSNAIEPLSPTGENVFVDLRCDPRTRPILPATEFSGGGGGGHKKKATSSFQITSVTVQGSRLGNNDGGEDSADDLDESHTEDISSDMLDCSKLTDIENDPLSSDNSNANLDDFMGLVALPVAKQPPPAIPVVNKTIKETVANFSISNDGVTLVTSTTTSPPVVNAQVPMVNSLPEHWQHRFKVVKIVSSEPFKRGRWLCMDFTDPPPPTTHPEPKTEEVAVVTVAVPPPSVSMDTANEIVFDQSTLRNTTNQIATQQQQQYNSVATSTSATNTTEVASAVTSLPLQTQVSVPPPQIVTLLPPPPTVVNVPPSTIANSQQHATTIPVAIGNNPTNETSSNFVSTSQANLLTGSDLVVTAVAAAPIANPSPLLDVLPDTLGTTKNMQDGEDVESAPSGTSTVAIDNKIEQAMDLVKSHLMFAVREEVDVLKEKITELVDRISQLELENGILRANASQETLSQLPSTVPGIQGIAQPQVVQSAPTITPAVHHMRPTQQTISAQVQTATGQSPQQTSS